jgi:hypothetical protein
MSISGKTTDATHRLILRPETGAGWSDNAVPSTTPLRYDSTVSACIRDTASYVQTINIAADVTVEFHNIQIKNTNEKSRVLEKNNYTQNVSFYGCLLEAKGRPSNPPIRIYQTSGPNALFENCAIIITGAVQAVDGRGGEFKFCTFYSTASTNVVRGSYGVFDFDNCLFLKFPDWQALTNVHTGDYCVTDLASWESSTAANSTLNATPASEIESDTGLESTVDLRAKSGGSSDAGGNPISGILLDMYGQTRDVSTPTVGAFEILAAGPAPATRNVTLNGEATHTVAQVMVATSNTTPGESVLGTDIIAVEDNMQFYAPNSVNGMNITWAADGTFTTDADQTETIRVDYFSPATGQWSCIDLTITQSSVTPAPTLSSPNSSNVSTGSATISATTDTASGTFYGYVSASATPPSAADLKAGTGAVWSGSQTVTTTGVQNISAVGLTPSTSYYGHMLQNDGVDSNIVSTAQFTTTAPEVSGNIQSGIGIKIGIGL